MLRATRDRIAFLAGIAVLLTAGSGRAEDACNPLIGVVSSSEGRVEVQRRDSNRWQPASIGLPLCEGDTVRAAELSRAAIQLINEAVLRVDQNTALQLITITARPEDRSILNLLSGAIQSFSRKPKRLAINTPYINGLVEGTEFAARIGDNAGTITVIEGTVVAENVFGSVSVPAGSQATAALGQPPRSEIVVNPRDAVQWGLYYPPLIAVLDGQPGTMPADASPALRGALAQASAGDSAGAIAALDRLPAAERTATAEVYRAAILLDAGQVEAARAAIDRALAKDPQSAPALALRSVIAVVQNDRDRALADGREAVRLAPDSATARIALSYAEQANFDIDAARASLEAAVAAEPDNALAWARLSEVRLMQGDRQGSRQAAATAVGLEPNLARTQMVEGYAALALFRNSAAIAAFTRAIELSPAEPMAHLGLGLAKISQGNLDDGRKDLEVAVALDSSRSLLRSYLGKAYFEERRAPLDAEQYDIAKQLDPNDPTPFLYSAISKVAENRPIEALRDIEDSIARNDNRAVFRGQLLLDEDRAVRQADQGQIYTNLGFRELGYREAAKSLALDPANAAAHRLLTSLSAGERRREISRISSLYQAQMLQDVNLVPVQPSLAVPNIFTPTGLVGPSSVGFSEFTPLFEQNQVQLNAQGLVGNKDTYGVEGVVTGVYDQVSASGGAFGYWTDNFRKNMDIDQKVANFFTQAAVSPDLNVQFEARSQRVENGFLPFLFDKDNYLPDAKRHLDQDSIRAGARYAPNANSDVLLSYIYNKRDVRENNKLFLVDQIGPFTQKDRFDNDDTGSQGEIQHIYRGDSFNITTGGSFSYVDRHTEQFLRQTDGITGETFFSEDASEDANIKEPRGYVYGNVVLPQNVTWTVGFGYQYYEDTTANRLTVEGALPKFGVQWDITDTVSLRAAAFRAIKPAVTNDRMLEPIQVAGFEQYFDDANGTKYWRFGGGGDWRITDDVAVGGEATWRYLDSPILEGQSLDLLDRRWETIDQREQNHRVYAYWTPTDQIALSASFVYDRFDSDDGNLPVEFGVVPERVTTYSVPLAVKYFAPGGFFAGVGGTFVHQDVRRAPEAAYPFDAEGNDSFFLVDTSIGYNFPKRLGLVSFEVRNLFDSSFKYQDDSYREFRDDPAVSRYFPERTFIARLILNY